MVVVVVVDLPKPRYLDLIFLPGSLLLVPSSCTHLTLDYIELFRFESRNMPAKMCAFGQRNFLKKIGIFVFCF